MGVSWPCAMKEAAGRNSRPPGRGCADAPAFTCLLLPMSPTLTSSQKTNQPDCPRSKRKVGAGQKLGNKTKLEAGLRDI